MRVRDARVRVGARVHVRVCVRVCVCARVRMTPPFIFLMRPLKMTPLLRN